MADPRGCDYREIETVIVTHETVNVDEWNASGTTNKTHGWILPTTRAEGTRYAIGWTGLIYPVVSIGSPANADDDARAMIRAMGPPSIPEQTVFEPGVQTYTDEEYSLNLKWLTPSKAAMIFRFGSPELVDECAKLFPNKDPFLTLSIDYLWNSFDRALSAHIRGDDELAYTTAITLAKARELCEAGTKARGIEPQSVLPGSRLHGVNDGTQRELYYPFLKIFPLLLKDQERRHARQTPLRDPATIANQGERIAALIGQLENISIRKTSLYSAEYDLSGSSTVHALIGESWDAVEPLLQCYEQDERLTRIVHAVYTGERYDRIITDVRSAAYVALEGIIETPQFAPDFSRSATPAEREAIYKVSASKIRDYANKYRGLSREDRLYAILKDDNGQWLEAASVIVQPTNNPVLPLASWPYPWILPLNLEDSTRMLGEALRAKSNPSVTELLIKRIGDTLERGKRSENDAIGLNGGCNLGFCLAKWDPQAALKIFPKLCDLSFSKLSPNNYKSYCSHEDLAGQLPVMIQFRARHGDTNALDEYATWLKAIEPQHFSLQIGGMLAPLVEFPDSPAWIGAWEPIFDDEQSVWFNYLLKQNMPDPKRMESPSMNVEVFFGSPMINNGSFRKFVTRLLHEKSACGRIMGGSAYGYWLDEKLSTRRRYGFTINPPQDGSDVSGREFRTCDFYAWLLSNRIEGAPVFYLYWPESKRDEAISAIGTMMNPANPVFKTRPFQER
jgi:hypothetical protein